MDGGVGEGSGVDGDGGVSADAGLDAGVGVDTGVDAGFDGDAGVGVDVGVDAGVDTDGDGGVGAGPHAEEVRIIHALHSMPLELGHQCPPAPGLGPVPSGAGRPATPWRTRAPHPGL